MMGKRRHPTIEMPTEMKQLILGPWCSKGGIQMDHEKKKCAVD